MDKEKKVFYRTLSLYWLIDKDDVTKIHPIEYRDKNLRAAHIIDQKRICILDKDDIVFDLEELMENLYRFSSTSRERTETLPNLEILLSNENEIDDKFITKFQEFYAHLLNRFYSGIQMQQKLFCEPNIEKRQTLLKKPPSIQEKSIGLLQVITQHI